MSTLARRVEHYRCRGADEASACLLTARDYGVKPVAVAWAIEQHSPTESKETS
ncbi:MAG: hypothetical protein ACYDAE_28095 [Steroidobacteraceae bacterium]|jgi:hypothetical protein